MVKRGDLVNFFFYCSFGTRFGTDYLLNNYPSLQHSAVAKSRGGIYMNEDGEIICNKLRQSESFFKAFNFVPLSANALNDFPSLIFSSSFSL